MNICVCMYYDDKIKDYGNINSAMNKNYCEKYNLSFICSNTSFYIDRHPAWERIPLLLNNIHNYDYLIWIDADAFFYNHANNITNIINNYNNYNFIFSNDISNNNINSGVFIVKNTQYSIDFLNKWGYDTDLYNNNPYPYWWDQGVLIHMYNNNILDIKNNSKLIDFGILQEFNLNDDLNNNTFVCHLAGRSHIDRFKILIDFYNKINN